MEFWTIEVTDGAMSSAQRWTDAPGERLVAAALTYGAKEWQWVTRGWRVLLELGFVDESDWLRFRAAAAGPEPLRPPLGVQHVRLAPQHEFDDVSV